MSAVSADPATLIPFMHAIEHAGDRIGAETLATMAGAPRYNRWQYERIAPFLGRRVCEVGAGIGNMSELIGEADRDLVVLTDTDPHYRAVLSEKFGSRTGVWVETLHLPDESAAARFQGYELDTVVALNVIEHIADDAAALGTVAQILQPAGRAVILVPALPLLYGSLDRELGHYRRYTPTTLTALMEGAGLELEHLRYFNLVGSLGWLVTARIQQASVIPPTSLRIFDQMVPLLRVENRFRIPFGQSLLAVGRRR